MSDISDVHIQPVPPVGGTVAVQPVRHDRPAAQPDQNSAAPHGREVAAITGGGLARAYAQITISQDTHDMVIEVRDAVTDEIINQYPSREIEAMNRYIQQYAETLARRRAAQLHDGSVA